MELFHLLISYPKDNLNLKRKLAFISCLISTVCLARIIYINHEIAVEYLSSTKKTQMLFFLTLLAYNYKYYYIIPSVIALLLAIKAVKKNEQSSFVNLVISLSIITILSVFLPIWRLMI